MLSWFCQKQAEMKIVSRPECHRQLARAGASILGIRDLTHICAQADFTVGMCPADRGGPLVCENGFVCGVASFTANYTGGCTIRYGQVRSAITHAGLNNLPDRRIRDNKSINATSPACALNGCMGRRCSRTLFHWCRGWTSS